jgi:hypothetical protein
LAGRVGEDAEGDALLFALRQGGVGHVAVIRDPARRTPIAVPASEDDDVSPLADGGGADRVQGLGLDGADVTLALRYLDPVGVLVVTDDVAPDALTAAVEGGMYADLRLVLLVDGAAATASLPASATILAAPDAGDDEAGAFEALVGAFAAALDAVASEG